MTHGRDGFSLAHRAALMAAKALRAVAVGAVAAVITSLAVATNSYAAGPIDPLAVTNANSLLQGSISTFAAGSKKNVKPDTLISGGPLIPGFSATQIPGGIAVSPATGALYITNNLSILAAGLLPDFVEGFAPNATGASGPIAAIPLVSAACDAPATGGACFPQDVAFVSTGGGLGEFYVSQFTGGPASVGNVILYPPDAGGPTNPLGIPLGIIPDTLTCSAGGSPDTALLLPVGVATDDAGNVYVANAGAPAGAPAYVTEYPAGVTGCVAPINQVGANTLVQAGFVAVDPAGNIWVSDLAQNAVFEFSPAGDVLTTIAGKKTQIHSPMGIAISPTGISLGVEDLYVASNRSGAILLFEDVGSGGLLNIHPVQALKGKKTKLNLPVGVAVMD